MKKLFLTALIILLLIGAAVSYRCQHNAFVPIIQENKDTVSSTGTDIISSDFYTRDQAYGISRYGFSVVSSPTSPIATIQIPKRGIEFDFSKTFRPISDTKFRMDHDALYIDNIFADENYDNNAIIHAISSTGYGLDRTGMSGLMYTNDFSKGCTLFDKEYLIKMGYKLEGSNYNYYTVAMKDQESFDKGSKLFYQQNPSRKILDQAEMLRHLCGDAAGMLVIESNGNFLFINPATEIFNINPNSGKPRYATIRPIKKS